MASGGKTPGAVRGSTPVSQLGEIAGWPWSSAGGGMRIGMSTHMGVECGAVASSGITRNLWTTDSAAWAKPLLAGNSLTAWQFFRAPVESTWQWATT